MLVERRPRSTCSHHLTVLRGTAKTGNSSVTELTGSLCPTGTFMTVGACLITNISQCSTRAGCGRYRVEALGVVETLGQEIFRQICQGHCMLFVRPRAGIARHDVGLDGACSCVEWECCFRTSAVVRRMRCELQSVICCNSSAEMRNDDPFVSASIGLFAICKQAGESSGKLQPSREGFCT